MKIYEYLLLALNIFLVCGGFFLWEDENKSMAIVSFSLAGVGFLTYLYYSKIRPMALVKNEFDNICVEAGWPGVEDKEILKTCVVQTLRCYQGFDELSVEVQNVYVNETDKMAVFTGMYTLSGEGINFGYFLLILARHEVIPDFLKVSKDENFSFEDDVRLKDIPVNLRKVLRDTPFPLAIQNCNVLIDLDSRDLFKYDFKTYFSQLVEGLNQV